MTTLRTLDGVTSRCRNLGLRVYPTELREVLFDCPICKAAGLKARAYIELINHQPIARCQGCENWGDDPHEILAFLGHDDLEHDEFEIILRIFDLLWAMHRNAQSTTARTDSIRAIESGAQTPSKANPMRTGDPMAPTSITPPRSGVLVAP